MDHPMTYTVTQEDRELFLELFLENPTDKAAIFTVRDGRWDDDWRMQTIAKFEAACREYSKKLEWIRGNPNLPGHYLGWHIADIATDMIQRAYPELARAAIASQPRIRI